jgi:hypothetical protein
MCMGIPEGRGDKWVEKIKVPIKIKIKGPD